jgi:Flp pilus assembly protein protease CpaA
MQILLVPILGWIAFEDLRTHRISNKSVLLLTLILIATLDVTDFDFKCQISASLIVLALSLALSFCCGLGMGDVKLIFVLALLLLPPHVASYQLFIFTVSLSGFIYALWISRGKLRQMQQIPLAPAIVVGTIIALIAK